MRTGITQLDRDDIFGRFYTEARDFTGDEAEILAVVNGRGAIWFETWSERALLMTSVKHLRLGAGGKARGIIEGMVERGVLAKDTRPLSAEVDIYVAPGKVST